MLLLLPVRSGAISDLERGQTLLRESQSLFSQGQYFKAARYAFSAQSETPELQSDAYGMITISLYEAGLYHSASYFFIRALESKNRAVIRRVLIHAEDLILRMGPDLFRQALIENTTYDDYTPESKSAYLFVLAKHALFIGQEKNAVGYLRGLSASTRLRPQAALIEGTALSILGDHHGALRAFQECAKSKHMDLRARCQAGVARVYYETAQFDLADRAYDQIPMENLIWPDLLFEQAWNAFARGQYNRALGKLVTYQAPLLKFVVNPEIDVLRAQSYMALCMYENANQTVQKFNERYTQLGLEIKKFIDSAGSDVLPLYIAGKQALQRRSIAGAPALTSLFRRFIQAPYFQQLVSAERSINPEIEMVRGFGRLSNPNAESSTGGFPAFLEKVLQWRLGMVQKLGGVFVQNSLRDHHQSLLEDLDKMTFIRLEVLSRMKESLLSPNTAALRGQRTLGNLEPVQRGDQYYWNFNGEFWADELGDYLFGLESRCGKSR